MKTPAPYDTLGVPRDAKLRDIKAAYRKRAAAAHPDKGGSDEELQTINHAWEILGDAEKRRRYDETGEMPSVAPATPGEGLFMAILNEALEKVVSERRLGTGVSVIEIVRKSLVGAETHTKAKLDELRRRIAAAEDQLGRYQLEDFVAKGEENLIEHRIRGLIDGLRGAIEVGVAELREIQCALQICICYRDTAPRPEDPFDHFQTLSWSEFAIPRRKR